MRRTVSTGCAISYSDPLLVLMGMVALVLLLACANLSGTDALRGRSAPETRDYDSSRYRGQQGSAWISAIPGGESLWWRFWAGV